MRSLLSNRRGTGTAVMLAAIVAVGLFSARLARQQASPTPLQLFQKMVPVIQHDRCANCHGGVDPIAGTDHEGGAIDTVKSHKDYEPCVKCHTKQPEWKIVENPDHLCLEKLTSRSVRSFPSSR